MRTEVSDEKSAIYLRCPQSLPRAIKQVARGNMTSASSYIRGAILSGWLRPERGCRLMAIFIEHPLLPTRPAGQAESCAYRSGRTNPTPYPLFGTVNSPPTTERLREPKSLPK
jgi:hypothetical protein